MQHWLLFLWHVRWMSVNKISLFFSVWATLWQIRGSCPNPVHTDTTDGSSGMRRNVWAQGWVKALTMILWLPFPQNHSPKWGLVLLLQDWHFSNSSASGFPWYKPRKEYFHYMPTEGSGVLVKGSVILVMESCEMQMSFIRVTERLDSFEYN